MELMLNLGKRATPAMPAARHENTSIMRRDAWTQQLEDASFLRTAGGADKTQAARAARKRLSHPACMKRPAYVGRMVLGEGEREENACMPLFQEACATAACSSYLES
jgi:hypothetical protein